MKTDSPKSHAKRLVLLCWILVAIFYFYLSWDYIRIQMNDDKFAEALQHIVQLAGNENRTSKDVRALVLVRADELGLPVRGDQITILGGGHSLNIAVAYTIDVDIPIFRQGFYTKHYNHKVLYRTTN
jgi:hypothetical protein